MNNTSGRPSQEHSQDEQLIRSATQSKNFIRKNNFNPGLYHQCGPTTQPKHDPRTFTSVSECPDTSALPLLTGISCLPHPEL